MIEATEVLDTCTGKAYWIAQGRYAGRLKLAEGDTRDDAIENWIKMLPGISQKFKIVL